MMLVKDMYNKLAIITGFPIYTNETDTPDINRFLFQALSEGLNSVIDDLYLSNNVLERTDTIVTIPKQDKYGIKGIIKKLQLVEDNGKVHNIPYNDYFGRDRDLSKEVKQNNPDKLEHSGKPTSYTISGGYLRLLPYPDKEYTIKATMSTVDLVLANDDTARNDIESVDDSILGNKQFTDLIILKAATLVFMRCQNSNAQVYMQLYQDRRKTFIEHDNGTMEAQRGWRRQAGHYNPRRGLLD